MKTLKGIVIRGEGRGKKFGFPTANIETKATLGKSDHGVYVSLITIGRRKYPSVTHIGPVKIFSVHETKVETHILDWKEDIYRKKITLEFVQKIRNTKDFSNIADLVAAIYEDISAARKYFLVHHFRT